MFDAAPTDTTTPLQQSDAFEGALRATGRSVHRLNDATLVLQRKFGPLKLHMLSRPSAQTAHEMHAIAKNVTPRGPVILSPSLPMRLDTIGALPLVSPQTVAHLDLRQNLNGLRANLHQKWRNRLKHGERQGLRLTRQNMPIDPDHWLLQADAQMQRDHRYRSWPKDLTLGFAHQNRSHAKLFTAFWGPAPVAGMLFLRHANTLTYHIGHTHSSGRTTSAHTVLMWQAICWAKRQGIDHIDLGMIDTEASPGLARFKLGTGAQVQTLGGTWLWWPGMTWPFQPLARIDTKLMRNR